MWFWVCKLPSGVVMMSESFNDWDECYEQYLAVMEFTAKFYSLGLCHWRGVFTATQATEIMTGHMQGEN